MEGMQAFGRRHFAELDRSHNGSSAWNASARHLCVVEAEGMLRMRYYTEASRTCSPRPARWRASS